MQTKRKQDGAIHHLDSNAVHERKWRKLKHDPLKMSSQKEILTRSWVTFNRQSFANLLNRSFLYPPIHFNRVSYTTDITSAAKAIKIPVPCEQMSDVREDEAQQRIHNVLAKVFGDNSTEVMFIVFELEFDNYLNDSRGCDTAYLHNDPKDQELLPELCLDIFARPRDLDRSSQRGRFDILFIHRDLGLMIFEVKAVGDAFSLSEEIRSSITKQHAIIRKRVQKSLRQLQKEETVLRYLLMDLGLGDVPVTKGLMLPNLSKQTVALALREDPALLKSFCLCLNEDGQNEDSFDSALQKCVFSDLLPPIGHSLAATDDIIVQMFKDWWSRVRGGRIGQSPAMTDDQYEAVVARFCGPATTQYVLSASGTRAEVSTLPQAVLEVSRCYTQLVATHEHLEILQTPYKRVMLTGQPGTNTNVLLMMKARQWLRESHQVVLLSLWHGSDGVTETLYHQILEDHPNSEKQLHIVSLKTSDKQEKSIDQLLKDLITIPQPSTGQPSPLGIASTDHNGEEMPQWEENGDSDLEVDSEPATDYEDNISQASGSSTTSYFTLMPTNHVPVDNRFGRNKEHIHTFCPGGSSPLLSSKEPNHVRFGSDPSQAGSALSLNGAQKYHNPKEPYNIRPHSLDGTTKVSIVVPQAAWFFKDLTQSLKAYPELNIWASSSFACVKPDHFVEFTLTQTLRRPPIVIKEAMTSSAYAHFSRPPMTSLDTGVLAGLPHPSDGPPVKRLHHEDHEASTVWDCQRCGTELATFLTRDLRIGSDKGRETIRYHDVLISGHGLPDVCNDLEDSNLPGFLKGLQRGRVPYAIFGKTDGEQVAVASSSSSQGHPNHNRVQIAHPECTPGLEKPVVVLLAAADVRKTAPRYVDPWFDVMSCCTSQLVVIGEQRADALLEKKIRKLFVGTAWKSTS